MHLAAAFHQLLIVRLIHMHAVATAVLGRIAGAVSGAQQRPQGFDVFINGYQADAGANRKALAVPAEAKLFYRVAYVFGYPHRLLQRAVVEEDAEFIAAQPRQQITATHAAFQ